MNWLLLVVVLAMEYQGCPRLLIGGEVDQEGAVQCITSVRQDSKSLVHASTTQGGKGNERPSYRPELDANVRKKKSRAFVASVGSGIRQSPNVAQGSKDDGL